MVVMISPRSIATRERLGRAVLSADRQDGDGRLVYFDLRTSGFHIQGFSSCLSCVLDCNVCKGGRYLGEYSIPPATHGSDTIYVSSFSCLNSEDELTEQRNRVNPVQQSQSVIYHGYAGAFASFFETGDPNAHKLTDIWEPGVPELQRSGEEFVLTRSGFENVRLRSLVERCALWESMGRNIPV